MLVAWNLEALALLTLFILSLLENLILFIIRQIYHIGFNFD
jgi:hypothetical protein